MRALVIVTVLLAAGAAEAGPRQTIDCQKNNEDGRVLVNGTQQKHERPWRVVRFDQQRNEGLWSYGRCIIEYR